MLNNKVINTYKKNNQVIFDNNSKENFLKYNETTLLKKINVNFDFSLINKFVDIYIWISRETGLKGECCFEPFKEGSFELINQTKKIYFKHFNTPNNKLNSNSRYSRLGFKFISLDIEKEHVPFIMVSLNYLPKCEGLYLIPILKNYKSILKLCRYDTGFFIKKDISSLDKHFYKEYNKAFYLNIKKTLKEYKIKKSDFILLPFKESLCYVSISKIENY